MPREPFIPSNEPWSEEERARVLGVLNRSADNVLARQRQESASYDDAGNFNPRSPAHEERMRRFYGEHYEGVKAEVDMRRTVTDLAKAMDSGLIPFSPEAAQAILDYQQDFMDSRQGYIIPSEDLDFDALRT